VGPNDLYQRILEKSSFAELAQYGFGILPDGQLRVELRTSPATTSVHVDSIAVVKRGIETHVVATYEAMSSGSTSMTPRSAPTKRWRSTAPTSASSLSTRPIL